MDLPLEEVADLLGVAEATLKKWVTEGKIPAYQINQEYRFSRPEIEDLLMRKHLPLASVRGRSHMQFSLYRALYRGDVLRDVRGETKEQIFEETLQEVAGRFDLDAGVLKDLFWDREKMMATGLGMGIGLPHTRDFLLSTHYDVVITVFPQKPLEYEALDRAPVHTLFFLFAADDASHLNLLAKISHFSAPETTRNFLQTRPSKEALLSFVRQWESHL